MFKSVIVFTLFILLPRLSLGQLVNIESQRMQTDSIRFVLSADFSFSHANNDGSTVNQVDGSLTSQFKSKDLRKIYFLTANYMLIDSDNQKLQNSWFLHARFNYKITQFWRFEAFIQSQFNELLEIQQRNLIGGGIRMKLFAKKQLTAYLGNSYLYEMEKNIDEGLTYYNHRNSSYLTLIYTPKTERFSVSNTVYYQPLYENLKDYRILEQFKLNVPLSKVFKVFALFNYYFDSLTPLGKQEYSTNFNFGLGITL